MLMRLFSSSDKHSLQKICSQHLVQINLVINLFCLFVYLLFDEAHDCSFSDVDCQSFSCRVFDQLIHCFIFDDVFVTQYLLYANMTLILLRIDQVLLYVIE